MKDRKRDKQRDSRSNRDSQLGYIKETWNTKQERNGKTDTKRMMNKKIFISVKKEKEKYWQIEW